MPILSTPAPPIAPAPWRADFRRDFQIRDRYDHPIAKLALGDTVAQTQAHGRLLASAPEALSLLKEIIEYDDICEVMGEELTQRIQELIQKTEGG